MNSPNIQSQFSFLNGWGEELYIIEFPGGKHACNAADTSGKDADPMEFFGLAVHISESSAEHYMKYHRETFSALFAGEWKVVLKSHEEVREIGKSKDLGALLLFSNEKIVDIEFLK